MAACIPGSHRRSFMYHQPWLGDKPNTSQNSNCLQYFLELNRRSNKRKHHPVAASVSVVQWILHNTCVLHTSKVDHAESCRIKVAIVSMHTALVIALIYWPSLLDSLQILAISWFAQTALLKMPIWSSGGFNSSQSNQYLIIWLIIWLTPNIRNLNQSSPWEAMRRSVTSAKRQIVSGNWSYGVDGP